MRYALFLPLFDELSDPAAVARLAAEAEEAGWDGVFVWDHIAYKPPVEAVADPWITLAAIATATERIRFGPMVTPLPRRRPAKVARETATLDRLGNGRLTLGVGIAGDGTGELSGTGEELDAKLRAASLDEGLDILQAAWTGETVHHRGEHHAVDGIRFLPRPVQEPGIPIWVAVKYGNTKPLRRAARYDGVFPVNVESPDQFAELVAAVTAQRAEIGADGPYDVAIGQQPGTDPAPYEAAGATWWMVSFDWKRPSEADVRAFLREGPHG